VPPEPGLRAFLATAALAGVVSGAPSTVVALVQGGDVLAATRAAGTLLPGRGGRPGVVAGVVAHAGLTLWWTGVLRLVLRRVGGGAVTGAGLGALVAAVDLGVVGRRLPAVRALPQWPQWADHVAFGVIVGAAGTVPTCRCTTSP
jgi:hypothetical protein